MAALTTQTISDAGTTVTYAAVSASDTCDIGNGLNTFLILKNGTAGPIVYKVAVPGTTFFGTPNDDNEITVPANSSKFVPLRKAYGDETGRATLSVPVPAAGIEAAVVRIA